MGGCGTVRVMALAAILVAAAGAATAATITGTNGGETLNGTPEADTVLARGGRDRIIPGKGDDRVQAGEGYDEVFWRTGDGNDTIDGGVKETGIQGRRDRLFATVTTPRIRVELLYLGPDQRSRLTLSGGGRRETLAFANLHSAQIDTGPGSDRVDLGRVDRVRRSWIIVSNSPSFCTIDTGPGDDIVTAEEAIAPDCLIDLGGGDDVLRFDKPERGFSYITTGNGDDKLYLSRGSSANIILGDKGIKTLFLAPTPRIGKVSVGGINSNSKGYRAVLHNFSDNRDTIDFDYICATTIYDADLNGNGRLDEGDHGVRLQAGSLELSYRNFRITFVGRKSVSLGAFYESSCG